MSKALTQLHEFLALFFLSPEHTFKIHIFPEAAKVSGFAQGVDANLNTYSTILTQKVLANASRNRDVLAFTPNVYRPGATTSEANLLFYNALFVDIDKADSEPDFNSLEHPPHFVFKRKAETGFKYHAYWLLNPVKVTEKSRKRYASMLWYFCELFGGDTSTLNHNRLMRLPYTQHSKSKKKSSYQLHIINEFNERYNLNDLFDALEHLVKPRTNGVGDAEVEGILHDFLNKHKVVEQGQGRSTFLYYVANLCYEWGVEQDNAETLVETFNQKLCDPPEDFEHVQVQVEKVFRYNSNEFGYKKDTYDSLSDYQRRKKFLQDEGRFTKMKSFLSNWVYVSQAELFVNVDTGLRFSTKQQLNAYLMPLFNIKDPYTALLVRALITSVDRITVAPERKEKVFTQDGAVYFNDFRGLSLEAKSIAEFSKSSRKDVAVFLKHLRYLVPRPGECTELLNYLAFVCQRPGKKVAWAPIIVSEHFGVGKSRLAAFLKNVFGTALANVENDVLNQKETDYMVNTLMVFVHELNQGSKFAVTNKLKTLITDEYVSIVAKYARTYEQPNITNFILLANKRDALAIEEGDRRFLVLLHDKRPKAPRYYKRLQKAIEESSLEIFSYLCERDLQNFNPYKPPMMTEAKRQMVGLTQTEADIFMQTLLEQRQKPFNSPVLTTTKIFELLLKGPRPQGLSLKAINRFLMKSGYKEKRCNLKIEGERKTYRLWSRDWAAIEERLQKDRDYIKRLLLEFFNDEGVEIEQG